MASVFGELADKLRRININNITKEVLEDQVLQQRIIEFNTRDQLFNQGISSEGQKLTPLDKPYPIYSEKYTKKKTKEGKYQGYIDLSFTGRWLRGFQVLLFNTYMLLRAKPTIVSRAFDLSEGLENRYGENIYGLTDRNLSKTSALMLPGFIKKLRAKF
jgi:hypothetical protein